MRQAWSQAIVATNCRPPTLSSIRCIAPDHFTVWTKALVCRPPSIKSVFRRLKCKTCAVVALFRCQVQRRQWFLNPFTADRFTVKSATVMFDLIRCTRPSDLSPCTVQLLVPQSLRLSMQLPFTESTKAPNTKKLTFTNQTLLLSLSLALEPWHCLVTF